MKTAKQIRRMPPLAADRTRTAQAKRRTRARQNQRAAKRHGYTMARRYTVA